MKVFLEGFFRKGLQLLRRGHLTCRKWCTNYPRIHIILLVTHVNTIFMHYFYGWKHFWKASFGKTSVASSWLSICRKWRQNFSFSERFLILGKSRSHVLLNPETKADEDIQQSFFSEMSRIKSEVCHGVMSRWRSYFKLFIKMLCSEPSEMFSSSGSYWIVNRLFERIIFTTLYKFLSVFQVKRRPDCCFSSTDSFPLLSLSYHF